MSECMQFPDTWEEFEQAYGFEDKKEIYTNGSRLIQSFRVKQWLDHIELDKLRDKYGVTSQNFADTSQFTCPKCHSEFVILPDANNPLTWDELKTMGGKPVWVEADYFEKGWFLVDASLVDIWVTGYDCAEHQLREENIGVSWQAYRKEII